jgi:hypothetical protein
MKLMRRPCCTVSKSRFWSLRTQFKGDYAIPFGCALEPEPTPFLKRRLPILRRGRWGQLSPWRRRRAVPGQLASHIRGRGEVRHGSTGENRLAIHVRLKIVDAWVWVWERQIGWR